MAVAITEQTDRVLIARLRQGDDDALGAIYDRYGATAYRIALRTLRDASLAEDAVQEAFLELWQRPGTYDHTRAQLGTWIGVLVHRRAVDIARREARRRLNAESTHWPAPDSATTEELVVLLTDRRRLDHALRRLEPNDRRIVELAYHGGMTQVEIAKRLELPLGTVKSRTFQALGRLRVLFEAGPAPTS